MYSPRTMRLMFTSVPARTALSLVFMLLVGLSHQGSAFAQDGAEEGPPAYQHFLRGTTAYEQGDYQSALQEWNSAYELDPRAELKFNLAQAYERLGRLQDAVDALDVYLEGARPDDPNQANARARRAALRERLSQTGVRIQGGPAGATISIDGESWGVTPRPDAIILPPGPHRLVVSAPGYEPFRASLAIAGGEITTVEVEMQEAVEVGGSESSGPGIAPWIVAGSGAALVVGAAVVGGLAPAWPQHLVNPL